MTEPEPNPHRIIRLASFGEDYWRCRVCGRTWGEEPAEGECPVRVIGVTAKCNDCGDELSAVGTDVADHVLTLSHSVTTRHIVLPWKAQAARTVRP